MVDINTSSGRCEATIRWWQKSTQSWGAYMFGCGGALGPDSIWIPYKFVYIYINTYIHTNVWWVVLYSIYSELHGWECSDTSVDHSLYGREGSHHCKEQILHMIIVKFKYCPKNHHHCQHYHYHRYHHYHHWHHGHHCHHNHHIRMNEQILHMIRIETTGRSQMVVKTQCNDWNRFYTWS